MCAMCLEGEGGRSGKRHTKELSDRRRHVVHGRIVRIGVIQVDIEAEFPHRLLRALKRTTVFAQTAATSLKHDISCAGDPDFVRGAAAGNGKKLVGDSCFRAVNVVFLAAGRYSDRTFTVFPSSLITSSTLVPCVIFRVVIFKILIVTPCATWLATQIPRMSDCVNTVFTLIAVKPLPAAHRLVSARTLLTLHWHASRV